MKRVKFDVYPIVNGSSRDSIFTGTLRQCWIFVRAKKRINNEFDWILLEHDSWD